ncbi:Copper-exporting P-type ATPase B [Candidatus Burarchaeum australiense]|nr:Copper-exporting P-type ATPase B [Candidatus Burarchaeum australiense]
METRTTAQFKEADIRSALSWLDAGEGGLSEEEASRRVKEFGFNEVVEKKTNPLLEFLLRFWGPIPWLLEVAALLSYLVGQTFDALVIALLLLVNTSISFYEEHDSQKALQLLKRKLTINARVLRDGNWTARVARELVPGDIITVGLGDVVPADAKILHGSISADQSALTGESLPVELREGGVLFTGSIVKRGEAKCVVVNTAMRTYFGKTVELVNIAKAKSKQEEIMFTISKYMIYLGTAAFLMVFAYSLLNHIPALVIMTFAVLFIGGGVPAALPVMFTISQATGATELSRRGILVTKLESIENAASLEVLCLDKTGTITKNELEIAEAISLDDFEKAELLTIASLASSAESKDAIDAVVLAYARANGASLAGYSQVSFTPFEPATKRTEAIVSFKGKKFRVTKGAPQMILSLCTGVSKAQKDKVDAEVERLSLRGCRVLAVAKSDSGNFEELSLVGLLALADPLRPDSAETIAALREAGIRPIMLTGDNLAVAREMAVQSGIGSRIVRISELKALPENEQAKALAGCDGIAEIYPEDKYWVVKHLQSRGYTVGMTGDGVNDAPALKQAELGIAVSSATDVAKAAASMVLTEPGTKVILEAVRTSRKTYQRMLTWTLKKIVLAIQFLLVLTIGFFLFQDVIISISGLVFLVFVNDFMTMSLAIDNARGTKNPNSWNIRNITLASALLGILFCIVVLTLLFLGMNYFHLDLDHLRTLVLLAIVYMGQLGIITLRERGHFWSSRPHIFVLTILTFAVVVFTLMGIYGFLVVPLPASIVATILAVTSASLLLMDPIKVYAFRKLGIS